jgi:hypothetical protein
VERLCRSALDQLYPERDGLELVVSPADAASLNRLQPSWSVQFTNLRITIDDTLNPGDCLVRSRFGVTDARASAKIQAVPHTPTAARGCCPPPLALPPSARSSARLCSMASLRACVTGRTAGADCVPTAPTTKSLSCSPAMARGWARLAADPRFIFCHDRFARS